MHCIKIFKDIQGSYSSCKVFIVFHNYRSTVASKTGWTAEQRASLPPVYHSSWEDRSPLLTMSLPTSQKLLQFGCDDAALLNISPLFTRTSQNGPTFSRDESDGIEFK